MLISRVAQACVLSLPAIPAETTSLALVDVPSSQYLLAKRVFAPCALTPLQVLVDLPDLVLPGRPIEFTLGVIDLHESTPAPEIPPWLLLSLRVSVLVTTDAGPYRNDAYCTVLKETDRTLRVRVLLHPSIWAGASALAIDAIMIDQSPVPSPHLPKALTIRFNHECSAAGSLWAAASDGDVSGLEAALAAGCSTEETQDVSRATWQPLVNALVSTALSALQKFMGVGRSALCEATSNAHAEAVRLLLAAGADVTPRDKVRLACGDGSLNVATGTTLALR